jgi:formate dehydrogenase subunit gamma
MKKFLSRIGHALGAVALLLMLAIASPAGAQQPNMVNPTADAVKEQQLLQELNRIQGRISIPDTKEGVLIQPAGQSWRYFHEVILRWIGAIALIGMLALLVVFYLVRGTVKLASGRSGRTIVRFDVIERSVHWMTAVSFIILALSGLNITFGKPLILPLVGPEMFTSISVLFKYAHNYLSFPFTIGVACMLYLWLKDNIPDQSDLEWVKQGGGIIGDKHPPARRFNAGQKGVFWLVVLGGAIMAISGYILMFPFYGTNIANMQWAQIFHGVVGVLLIAAIFAHIYIGTLGMEGAFEAMGSGDVDLNWAKEHHRLWVEQEMGGKSAASGAKPRMTPAE